MAINDLESGAGGNRTRLLNQVVSLIKAHISITKIINQFK